MGHGPIHPHTGHPGSGSGSNSACAQLEQDIANYQAKLDQLNRELAATDGPDARRKILDEIAATAGILEDIEASYARNCARGPISPVPFQIGAWQLQSPFGIRLSDDLWQTGSAWAVHPLPGGRLLVGTEQGGLWLSEPDGQGWYSARCLSDSWSHWGFTAFVADPADPDRIFAGANDTLTSGSPGPGIDGKSGGVYVGRASRPDDPWTFIVLPASISGGVLSMIILPGLRRLLVVSGFSYGANANQLCWLDIDSSPLPLVLQADPQTASDVANADGDSFFITDQLSASLGVGRFGGSTIVFNPVGAGAIAWTSAPLGFTPMRIASCKTKPKNAYCLGYVGNLQRIFVIRTQDGGNSWSECAYSEPNLISPGPNAAQNFWQALDAFDPAVKSPYSIAVHPTDPLTVAVAYGAAALSNDGGTGQWLALNPGGTVPVVPLHADIHRLCFDDATDILFIPSDGGLLSLPSMASFIDLPLPFGGPASYFSGDSKRNRTLPVVMLDAIQARGSRANLAVGAGIAVSGTQDNANLWLDPSTQVWGALEVKIDGPTGLPLSTKGDGGVVAISAQASGTYVLHGENADKLPVQWAQWQGSSWGPSINVPGATGGQFTGLTPILRPVSPAVSLFAPSPVIALACQDPSNISAAFPAQANNIVFGAVVFAFPSSFVSIPTRVFWVQLGAVPATEVITALEAFDNSSVLAGTQSGRLFRVSLNGSRTCERFAIMMAPRKQR